QVEGGAQIDDRLLPRENFRGRARRQQPTCEPVFAGPGARGTQQFIQRARPKQIQIFGVNVSGVTEAIALLAGPGPAMLDASQASLVKDNGTPRPLQSAENACMPDH